MKTVLRLYKYNFLIILGLAIAAILIILKLADLPSMQFLICLVLIFFYLAWALLYHFIDKSLTLEVILEYVLTALLAAVVLYGILL